MAPSLLGQRQLAWVQVLIPAVAKMAQVFPITHRLREVREEVFGVARDPELVLNSFAYCLYQKKASAAKIQFGKPSCLLQMGKLRHGVGKYYGHTVRDPATSQLHHLG